MAKGRGGCEQDWETRTSSERSSFGEEENFPKCVGFRGIQVGAVGLKSREDEVSLQEMFWGSFEADRSMGTFLLQLEWVSELVCVWGMLTGVCVPGAVAGGLGHAVPGGEDGSVGVQQRAVRGHQEGHSSKPGRNQAR